MSTSNIKSGILATLTLFSAWSFSQGFDYGWHSILDESNNPEYKFNALYGDTLFVLAEIDAIDSIDVSPGSVDTYIHDESVAYTSSLLYVSKFSVSTGEYYGSFKLTECPWIGSSGLYSRDFEISPDGTMIVTGYAKNLVDFDGSSNTASWYSPQGDGSFVAFYETTGEYIGHIEYGGNSSNFFDLRGIEVDSDNNVYLAGHFYGTIDFDFTAGTETITSNGGDDIAILKLSISSQTFEWVRTFGGTDNESCQLFSVSGNDLLVGGLFASLSIDLDGGAGTDIHTKPPVTSEYSFYAKYDLDGTYSEGHTHNGYYNYDVASDDFGNYYILGEAYPSTPLDIDFGTGTYEVNVSLYNSLPIYIAKYDNDLNFIWGRTIGGDNYSIYMDATTNLVSVSGYFSDTLFLADQNLVDTVDINSEGGMFILTFKANNGELADYADYPFDQNSYGEGLDVILSDNNDIISTGSFQKLMDFNTYDSNTIYDTTAYESFYLFYAYIIKTSFNGFLANETFASEKGIKLFPNPVISEFSVLSEQTISLVDIYDNSGRLILSLQPNSSQFPVSTENFAPGIYFVKTTNIEGHTDILRIVRQ